MKPRLRLLVLPAALLWASGAFAQGAVILELSYSNPGARSLGFGGAFVALADDATAAYANPAGLVQLTRPEVSVEGRSWAYSTPFVQGGRASGAPTGLGIDTAADLRWTESEADLSGLSFLSYVHPWKRWSLALYRHQLAEYESSFATDGLFAEGSAFLDTDRWIDRPGSTDLAVLGWGFAAARRLTDSLSLGLALTYLEVDLELETTAYLPDDDTLEGFFAANSFLPRRSAWQTSTQAHDATLGATLGLLFRASERWSVGGFVRTGFDVTARFQAQPGPAGSPENPRRWDFTSTWSFPRAAGLGCAYRSPGGRLTLGFEWDRVWYSQISEDDPDEAVPDADELHLGGEVALVRSRSVLALRLGVWLDPDHRIRAREGSDLFRAVLSPGTDEVHYAVGLGAAFERYQIDLGADFSDSRDTLSVSAIFSF